MPRAYAPPPPPHPTLQNGFRVTVYYCIGLNRPTLGGTVPNSTTMSRCPDLLTFCPTFIDIQFRAQRPSFGCKMSRYPPLYIYAQI